MYALITFQTKTRHALQRRFGVFRVAFGLQNHRAYSPSPKVEGIFDRLKKYFFSSKIWWSTFGGNKLTKWGKFIRSLCVMKTPNKFNCNSEKNEVWFDHFQMEFDLHIWWLSSPHEYFEMVEYQGDSPLRSDRTGNWLFLYQNAWFPKVIYIGKHYGFPNFCQFVFPKFRPPDLRAEKIFFQTVFCTSKLNPKTY